MKLEELREMKKGTPICWGVGSGTFQHGTFEGLAQITHYGRMTIDEFLRDGIDLNKGRKVWEARVKYIDEKGREKTDTINPRGVRRW